MKRLTLTVLVVGLTLASLLAQQQQPRIVSPEVLSDGRVTFRLNAPKADEVLLTGEFLDGNRKFEKGADGIWSVTVGPIEPEIYHYNFTIDGVRTIDPGNPQLKTGSTASTITSVLEVTERIARVLRRAAGAARRNPHSLVSLKIAQQRAPADGVYATGL